MGAVGVGDFLTSSNWGPDFVPKISRILASLKPGLCHDRLKSLLSKI